MLQDHEVPLIRLFPEILNKNVFIQRDHPKINPEIDRQGYESYWSEEKKRCIEGFWAEEKKGHWRYMNPDLYFYINHWLIEVLDDTGEKKIDRPFLWDVVWYISSVWTVCRRFSGFADDEEYNGHYLLKKYWQEQREEKDEHGIEIELTRVDKKRLKRSKHVLNSEGEYKKYKDPYKIISSSYSRNMGLPCYDNPAQDLMLFGARGLGKDLEENTTVHTALGPVPIKDIEVGDSIFGADGKLTKVVSKTNYYDQLQYRVTFSDGKSVECGAGHLWNVHRKSRNKKLYPSGYKYCTMSLGDIYKDYKIGKRGDNRYYVDMNSPIEYEERDLPVDPYFLGLWLGDGSSHNVGISTDDKEIVDEIYSQAKKWDKTVNINKNRNKSCPTYILTNGPSGKGRGKNEVLNAFRNLGVINNKHIPDIYLRSSYDQRLSLLQGLMDSDGYCNLDQGSIEFTSSYEGIQDTFGKLVSSLGIRFKNKIKKTYAMYSMRFRLFTDKPIFRLDRKLSGVGIKNSKYSQTNRSKSAIVNIEPLSVKPSVCIGVDNKDSLFVVGDNYVVTHNSYFISACTGREFTFDGARYYKKSKDNLLAENGGKVFCASQEERHVSLLYDKVMFGLDNFSGGYETVDKNYPPPFYKHKAGTFESKSGVTHKYEIYYKIGGKQYKGTYSTMYRGIYSSNINQAIGNRVNQGFVDECGLILELPTIHGANRNVLERGGIKNASVAYTGTGGDIKKVDGAKSMFYNPRQNSLYSFPNNWEEGGDISMFISAEYSLQDFKDPQGNTILEEAREELLKRRADKAGGTDPTGYNSERMYMPIKPSDMFLIDGDLVYNQSKVNSRIAYLQKTKEWKEGTTFAQIKCFGNKFEDVQIKRGKFEQERPVLTRVVGEMDNTQGSIVFYKEPDGSEEFRLIGSRYRIAYDPVRRDGSELSRYRSLASILVWDTLTDELAAEFIGRRETPEEIHEICLNLGIYYNCPILVETNVTGFKNAAKRRGLGYMLYPTPIESLSKKVSGLKYSEGDIGVEVTGKTKPALIEFSQSFVNKKDAEGYDLYDKIKSLRLLEEMETWDGEINADHISSFLLLSVWEEEEREHRPMETPESKSQYKDFKKLLSNYKNKKRMLQTVYQT